MTFFPTSLCFPAASRYSMLVNTSSSTSSTSLPPVLPPYCATLCYLLLGCFKYPTASLVLTVFSITNILLLLPLLILASCDELRRQRRTRRTSTQCHLFTCHAMLFELLGVFGWVVCLCGILTDYDAMKIVWLYVLTFTVPGQTLCHVMSCLERYMAVRHPITFRRLKEAKMVSIRRVVVGLIWLVCCFKISLLGVDGRISFILTLCHAWVNLSLSSFCSISALCALNRPELQRRCGDRGQTDKSKLMAFYTIMLILVGLWLRYFGHMLVLLVFFSVHMDMADQCFIAMSGFWFGFPTSLILLLLFVYRSRKRFKCRNGTQEKQVHFR